MHRKSLFIWVAAIVGLLGGCSKQSLQKPVILGHGGHGFYSEFNPFPANAPTSVRVGLQQPILDGVELDVQCSKEGDIWFFHDRNLIAATGVNGAVSDFSSSELETVEFQIPQPGFDPLLNWADLKEMISDYPHKWVRLQLIQDTGVCLQKALELDIPPRFSWSLSNWESYVALREKWPNRTWLTSNQRELVLNYFKGNLPHGLEMNVQKVERWEVEQLHNLGVQVSLYGFDSKSDLDRITGWNIQEIQADNITLTAIHYGLEP